MSGVSQGQSLAVVGATVWDGTGRDPARNQLIEVTDGKITAMRSMDKVPVPKDRPVLDAEGRHVIPGLIDCHVHIIYARFSYHGDYQRWPLEYHTLRAAKNAAMLLSYGYTTIRDVGSREAIAISVRDAIREGRLRGPRIHASGQVVRTTCGQAEHYPTWITNPLDFGVTADGPDEFRRVVRDQIKRGVDNIKVGISGSEASPFTATWQTAGSLEEMSALTAEARRFGKTVACHAQSYEGARIAVEAGVTTIEHGTRLDEETLARMAAAEDIYLVPTLCTIFSWLELSTLPHATAEMEINKPLWLDSLRRAKQAGVKIAVGSDLGNRYLQGEQAIELGLLVEQGFTPEEALIATTRTAARALHRAHEVGTLEVGKLADLLVLNADPLADVGILRKREAFHRVVQGGEALVPGDIAPEVRREPRPA